MLDLSKIKKIYFVGIGGIGMSAVAGLAKASGYDVSGSDSTAIYEPSKSVLQKYAIDYAVGYDASNLTGADLVVATAAVDQSNPEIAKAISLNLPIISYPELLGQLSATKRVIVVSGTHGKGTTAGLLGFALKNLSDSSFFVGGVLRNFESNFYFGQGPDFVIEGDEYKLSDADLTAKFLSYNLQAVLINNLEWDHTDIYSDLGAMQKVFGKLAEKVPANGFIAVNGDSEPALQAAANASAKKIIFSSKNRNADIFFSEPICSNGDFLINVVYKAKTYFIKTPFPGLAYAYNNVAAFSVLVGLGYEPEIFLPLFAQYQGLKRRFEILQTEPCALIDDYAHHPGAVAQTLSAVRQKFPQAKIFCYFEPHTFSRTTATLPQLATAFADADQVFISEVYPAREQKLPTSITGQHVVDEIAKHNPNVQMADSIDDLAKIISAEIKPGDAVVAMTVGDNGTKLLEMLRAKK